MKNKYKLVSLFLAFALLVALVRLCLVSVGGGKSGGVSGYDEWWQRDEVVAYAPQVLTKGQVDTLLRVAMQPLHSEDMPTGQYYVVTDTSLLRHLAEHYFSKEAARTAPMAIMVCGDTTMTDDEGNISPTWRTDGAVAVMQLRQAAEAMQLAATPLFFEPKRTVEEEVRSLVNMPEGMVPIAFVPIGYPQKSKPRTAVWNEEVIHLNKEW